MMECFSDQTAQHSSDPAVAVDVELAEKDDFSAEKPTTVSRLFQKAVAMFPDHPALRYRTDKTFWDRLTYSQYYNKCLEAARACIKVCINYNNIYYVYFTILTAVT